MINEEALSFYFMRVFDVLMVFAPNIGFIAQIIKFRKMKSSQGFSKLLTFTIQTSNILRIFFWIGKRFALPLLFQSIMSVFMQMYLIHECLKYPNTNANTKKELGMVGIDDSKTFPHHLTNFHRPISILDLKNFWNWPHLVDYIYIIVLFSLTLGFLSNMIGFDNVILVESFGIGSACFEAIVGIPQIIQNFKNKNTETLSIFMIMTWFLGDVFKTIYYIKTGSPLQLICYGSFQISADLILIMQIICYYKNTKSVIEYKSVSGKDNNEIGSSRKSSEKNVEKSTSSSDTDSSGEEFMNIV